MAHVPVPQLNLVQSWLQPLHADFFRPHPPCSSASSVKINFDNICPPNAKLLRARFLNALFEDRLAILHSHIIIATDPSQSEEKARVGMLSQSLEWFSSIRSRYYTPIFRVLAILLALPKLQHKL